jgi:hypothetical protein
MAESGSTFALVEDGTGMAFAPLTPLALAVLSGSKPLKKSKIQYWLDFLVKVHVQCDAHGLGLCCLDSRNLGALFLFVEVITSIPMNVLVLLPSTGWGIDTVTEIVLHDYTERLEYAEQK